MRFFRSSGPIANLIALAVAVVQITGCIDPKFTNSKSEKKPGGTKPSTPASVVMSCPGGTFNGNLVITENTQLSESCTIVGDLWVKEGARFEIDYSSGLSSRFVVRGDVKVEGASALSVAGRLKTEDQFVIANDFSQQRSMTASGSATIHFKNIEFRTQETIAAANGSLFIDFNASDSARLLVENSFLDVTSAWLLANFNDGSSLEIVDSQGLPTENYVHEAATVKIKGPTTSTGFWLDAVNARGAITLPSVNAPFSWTVGRGRGLDVGWLMQIENAQPGMGIEIRENTQLEITGNGAAAPTTGELKISYFVVSGTEVLSGLTAGIQNKVVSPRLRLNNVQLGPIAWQIYAGSNANVTIQNSTINEIGIYGANAMVTVQASILQLAVLGAMGPGSRLNIANSDIWNQSIESASTAQVSITGSRIHGSQFHARAATSSIAISANSSFLANPSGCTTANMVNIATGQPLCNPFRPAGFPTKIGLGPVTCQNTTGCSF